MRGLEEVCKTACVILNYNSASETGKLVNAIQNYKNIDYIVVVDNNSTDKSSKLLASTNRWNDKVYFLQSETNLGYAGGNNYGANFAVNELDADYVIIANPDVMFGNEYVVDVLRIMKNNSKIIVASAIAHDINDTISYCCYWKLPSYKDYIRKFFPHYNRWHEKKLLKKQCEVKKEFVIVDAVSGACFIADKILFKEFNGINEDTFLYCEESILGAKIKKNGYCEAVSYLTYYNHNHVYKNESNEKKLAQYIIMNKSRRYYLKEIIKTPTLGLLVFDFFVSLSVFIRKRVWKL